MEIPGLRENPLPKELVAFLNEVQENIGNYPETVVYNRIKDYITQLSTKQIAWLTSSIIVSTEFRLRIFKKRCDAKDKLACELLSLAIDGDPYSKNETIQLGLKGLWRVNHDIEAGKILVELDVITQEEFDNIVRSGRDKEILTGGKTREQKLEELAEEAKTYPNADAFSMAMIMGRLKSVPQPNTANVYAILKGKYASAEDFHHAVAGEVSVPEKEAVDAVPPTEVEKPIEERYTAYLYELNTFILTKLPPRSDPNRITIFAQEINKLKIKHNLPSTIPLDLISKIGNEPSLAPVEKEIPPPPKEKEASIPHPRLGLFKQEILDKAEKLKKEEKDRMAKLKDKKGTREGVEDLKILYNTTDSRNWTENDFINEISIASSLTDLKSIHGLVDKSGLTGTQKDKIKEMLVNRMQAFVEGAESYAFPPGVGVIDESHPKYSTVAEGEEIEPQDYTEYTYGDFEVLIKGLDDIEDLEDVLEYIDLSKVISDNEKTDLINMVEKRISELQKGV